MKTNAEQCRKNEENSEKSQIIQKKSKMQNK